MSGVSIRIAIVAFGTAGVLVSALPVRADAPAEPDLRGPSAAIRVLPAPPALPKRPAPPKPPSKAAPVQWTSPAAGAVLFRPATVTLGWAANAPAGTTYNVAMSTDGRSFGTLLAEGLTGTRLAYELPDIPRLTWFLRVRGFAPDGRMVGQDTLTLHAVPKDAIVVSKVNQRLWAFSDGRLQHRYLVSTGQIDYDTRAGWFSVYSRQRKHRSSIYDVEMPFALFFSGGQAIHSSTALRQLGRPASHGCVRLPRRNAQALFEDSDVGRPVIITDWHENLAWLDGRKRSAKTTAGAAKPSASRVSGPSRAGR